MDKYTRSIDFLIKVLMAILFIFVSTVVIFIAIEILEDYFLGNEININEIYMANMLLVAIFGVLSLLVSLKRYSKKDLDIQAQIDIDNENMYLVIINNSSENIDQVYILISDFTIKESQKLKKRKKILIE